MPAHDVIVDLARCAALGRRLFQVGTKEPTSCSRRRERGPYARPGRTLSDLLESYRRTIETSEIEQRLAMLEESMTSGSKRAPG